MAREPPTLRIPYQKQYDTTHVHMQQPKVPALCSAQPSYLSLFSNKGKQKEVRLDKVLKPNYRSSLGLATSQLGSHFKSNYACLRR